MAGKWWRLTIWRYVSGIASSFRRFPLPLACAGLFCLLWIADNHHLLRRDTGSFATQAKLYLAIGFFWSLATALIGESRGWRRPKSFGLAAVGLLLPAWPVLTHDLSWAAWLDPTPVLFIPASILLTMAAPFLVPRASDSAFWEFNRVAWLSAAFGLLVALLAGLGLRAMVTGVEVLFSLEIPSSVLEDIWVLAFGLLAPTLALSGFPECFSRPTAPPPRWVDFLATYLLVPLVALYMVLIYAYIGTILASWELPRGRVVWLIAGFAITGVITQLFSYPLTEEGRRWVRIFHRHFLHFLWPPLILLWIALWTRVGDYGVTEGRYLVALFAVWLTLLCGGFALRRHRLTVVPLSLALLLTLAEVGPWGAAQVSIRSQLAQLTDLLERNGLLREGRLVPATKVVPFEDQKRISSIVRFLGARDKRPALAPMLAGQEIDPVGRSWVPQVMGAMKLDFISRYQDERVFHFLTGKRPTLDVAGYDHLISFDFVRAEQKILVTYSGDGLVVEPGHQYIKISDAHGRSLRFDLGALVERARQDPEAFKNRSPALQQIMVLEDAVPGLKARLIVQTLQGGYPDAGPRVDRGRASLLVALQ